MESISSALNKEYMSRLDAIRLNINNKVNSGYNGIRRSNAKGSSLEFSDFKDYVQGDDIRRIDWNSYGRFNKLFVKLFSEERQTAVNIFLDKSKSMDFGEINKSYYSKLFAASIAYLTLKSADKFNIFAFDEKISIEKTNVTQKNLFPAVVKFLDNISPTSKTSLNKSISQIQKLPGGVSFIVSDFFAQDGFEDAIKLLQSRKQEVILIHVLAKEEILPKVSDGVRLLDSETNNSMDIFITNDILNKYKEALKAFTESIAEFCKKRNVSYIFAPTDNHILKIISKDLARI